MKNIVSRYSLLFVLGVVAFVPLGDILSPGSSQAVPSVAPEVSLKQLSPSVSQKQVPSKRRASTQRYTNSTYGVTFSYPSNWQPTQGYENRERFSGADGFFHVTGLLTPPPSTIQDVCNNEARNHRLIPYGTRPQVQQLQIQGRPACLILPSADQDKALERMATLIVRYPNSIRLNGTDDSYFMLHSNKENIRQIISRLRFTMPRR
ncbi:MULTISPECIES: hypothetical protein [Cyanophyceae]|uniref:hypothetical protein n=1 Tax=Cyanophyceae TaxID=3028117 RepID=UPI0016829AC8|nr:hypothetical protein [Trichocoleus sp. FACHB-40]MBD2003749.1 hypothetical protein [Trichocoleus sp. FACHB-40]